MVNWTKEDEQKYQAYQKRNDKSLGWDRVNELLKELENKWKLW